MLLTLAYAVALAVATFPIVASDADFTVFGYLPEYRKANFDYAGVFSRGLTHLIFFSLEVDPKTYLPTAIDRLPNDEDLSAARAAADNVKGKLILGFGGNARSNGFSEMAATKKSRWIFLDAVRNLLEQKELDGIDLNWEYPATPQDWKNWGLLMKEAKETLGTRNFVSFTMYNVREMYDLINGYKLLADADYLHCMAYDHRDKHSTTEFAQMALFFAKSLGKDMRKWTLGLPFYGRNVITGEPKAFYELASKISDTVTDLVGEVFYNSQKTIYEKIILAKIAGAGGVMIWELGQDIQQFLTVSDGTDAKVVQNERSLMTAVYQGVTSKEHEQYMANEEQTTAEENQENKEL